MTGVNTSPPVALADGISREYLLHHRVCPRAYAEDSAWLVLAAAPGALLDGCLDDFIVAYGCDVEVEPTSQPELEAMIERLCAGADRAMEVTRPDGEVQEWATDTEVAADVRDLATQPPVIRFVNLLVRDAHEAGASDVHLEATRDGLQVRFRLDGVLVPVQEPPPALARAVVSRIKLLAELDIAERRRPQDGRIRVRLEARELDLRVSTVPTMFGESVVLRLLERGGRPVELEELGMPADLLRRVGELSARPHGLLLVTGPTGSGKTTTLYACLQRRAVGIEKVITVEDPVEYQLGTVTQVPVHTQAGVTFGTALRSILRQDPDVVMVGEMRDAETAEVAIQAAMTGHLVFSTLHTNDAVSAVPRLLDLGVPAYLAAATLEGVLAQRLVRRVCDACRVSYVPPAEVLARLSERPLPRGPGSGGEFCRGVGCAACRGTGYRGRIGVFELLVVNDAVKDAIAGGAARAELRRVALATGMRPLLTAAWAKVEAGLTTVEEVLRVVHD